MIILMEQSFYRANLHFFKRLKLYRGDYSEALKRILKCKIDGSTAKPLLNHEGI